MKKITARLLLLSTIAIPFYLTGCISDNATKGGGIGTVAEEALGVLIGDKKGRNKESILSSVFNAGIGTYIGNRLDQQALALQAVPGMEDVQVNKDEGNQEIESRMQIQFDFDDDQVRSSEQPKLDQLAGVLAQYPENIVVIEGHTDSSGEVDYNQDLSERRAMSIKNYLDTKNLSIASLTSTGFGETKPITSNDTEEGKATNRRVEINITIDQAKAQQLYEQETQKQ